MPNVHGNSRILQMLLLLSIVAVLSLVGVLIQGYAMDDIFPPESFITIKGSYNNSTGWYYDSAPVATFTAKDDLSGVKYIVIPYNNDGQCGSNRCYIQPGDSITLRRQIGINKGSIILNYFAVDNAGNAEKAKKLSIQVDTLPPDLYIMKVKTDSRKNIPTGNLCKDIQKNSQCVMISAKVNEKTTFQMVASDLISGIDAVHYRILKPLEKDPSRWQTVEKNVPRTLDLQFDKAGIYHLQLKAGDKAGNESGIKDFWMRVG